MKTTPSRSSRLRHDLFQTGSAAGRPPLLVGAALSALACASPAMAASEEKKDGEIAVPPSSVFIKGGETEIGVDPDEIAPIIAKTRVEKLVGETPKHEVEVDDFYMMVTEVTNEQFEAFVRDTGSKPPQSWGEEAINAATVEYSEVEGKRKQEAREQGLSYTIKKFDKKAWWDRNWESATFAIPEGKQDHPVEFVDYEMATSYARWAGLRLPTEFEFQRAIRGKTDRDFPWGDDFGEGNAATFETGQIGTWPVGSFASGASEEGVYDLVGNVWEWTMSEYLAYPKYEPVDVEFDDGRTVTCYTAWDASQRVVVSGSYTNEKEACRASVRRATDRGQATAAMGFRCAATPLPGKDATASILRYDVPGHAIPNGVSHAPDLVVGMDRWQTSPGASPTPGYEIISGYDRVLFIPAEELDATGLKGLATKSIEEQPIHLGLLVVDLPLQEPALDAGIYQVRWRAEGESRKRPKKDEEEEGEDGEAPPPTPEIEAIWPTDQESLVFFDVEGDPVLAIETRELDWGRLKPGRIDHRVVTPSDEEREEGAVPYDELRFTVPLNSRTRQKGLTLDLRLKLAEGTVGSGWRKTTK